MKAIAKLAFLSMSALAWDMGSLHAQQTAARLSLADAAGRKSPCSLNPSDGSTQIAVAWLNDVKGEVQLAKRTGREFQPAYAHTPITQGNILQTGMGRAEVEFEDNSTVRLGPYSLVEFPCLQLLSSGSRSSNISALKGTVYASFIPAYIAKVQWIHFQLTFGRQTLYLQPSSHVRLELDATGARLAVLDGGGRVEGPFGTIELIKKRTFTFSPEAQSKPDVLKKVVANPMDAWDSSAVKLHQNKAGPGKKGGDLFEPPLRP
jgi:hypothetical protein